MRWITTTYPTPGLIGFPIDDAFVFRFNTDLKKNSLNGRTIQLWNLDEQNKVAILLHDQMYDSIRRTLTIKPILQLQAETRYQLILLGAKDGIENIINEQMEETFVLEFMTGNRFLIQKPRWISPNNESVVNLPFELEWAYGEYGSTSTDLSDMNASFFEIEISNHSDFLTLVWPTEAHQIYGFQLTPYLTKPGQYFIRIRASDNQYNKGPYSELLIVEAISAEASVDQSDHSISNPSIDSVSSVLSIPELLIRVNNRNVLIQNQAQRIPIDVSELKLRFSNAITFHETPINGLYESIKWFESKV